MHVHIHTHSHTDFLYSFPFHPISVPSQFRFSSKHHSSSECISHGILDLLVSETVDEGVEQRGHCIVEESHPFTEVHSAAPLGGDIQEDAAAIGE